MIILEEDANLQGQHFRISWEVFQGLMRGTEPYLLGPDEYVHAVKFQKEDGIMLCIRNREYESNEKDLHH